MGSISDTAASQTESASVKDATYCPGIVNDSACCQV